MTIDLIDITKTNDIMKIIKEFRMKLNVNDDDFINESWQRCAEIMAEDEEKAIQFIKDNYNCEYKLYIAELIEPYFEKTKSKKFIMGLWDFFRDSNEYKYIDRIEPLIYQNDWEEEEWV